MGTAGRGGDPPPDLLRFVTLAPGCGSDLWLLSGTLLRLAPVAPVCDVFSELRGRIRPKTERIRTTQRPAGTASQPSLLLSPDVTTGDHTCHRGWEGCPSSLLQWPEVTTGGHTRHEDWEAVNVMDENSPSEMEPAEQTGFLARDRATRAGAWSPHLPGREVFETRMVSWMRSAGTSTFPGFSNLS